ncbi:MAG: Arc family DNA-binding protein [Mesorhizobium sp.]|uniref:Arc family DNA-binding protein n=1 Tax=Mesorhizobium sp. TaxID=1871066 RepID=UPI0011F9D59E|nr:Arc family DNA-binding protein [Mesorhizobium sp.]TIW09550.1 MAG: Arc family DNA-binding protein [Mesorhizobium sp.]
MSKPEPPSFHLRLPTELKAKLQAARGRNSLNQEIVDRLERSLDPDPAMQVADVLRPLLASLDESARTEMARLLCEMLAVIAKRPKRGR